MRFVFPMAGRTDPRASGWWIRNDVMGDDGFQPTDLYGQTLISPSGATGLSPAILIPKLLDEDPSFDPSQLKHDRMALADMPIALMNGAVGAANLTAPFWQPVEESGCCTFLDYGVDWPTTAIIFGRRLLDDQELANAFLRAVTRTTEENLQPGYHDNAELMEQIAGIVEQPVDALTGQAELSFLEPMDVDAMMSLQEYYRTIPDAVSYPEDLAADQVFDLTWTEELLGQSS
jgi:ABC-type nitrate/sulfonate/bicarbonate transport system substrate-binding protein